MRINSKLRYHAGLFVLLCCTVAARLSAQENENANQTNAEGEGRAKLSAERSRDDTAANVLSGDDWQRVDEAVERAGAELVNRVGERVLRLQHELAGQPDQGAVALVVDSDREWEVG